MSRYHRCLRLRVAIIAILFICAGCGLKSDPIPPKIKLPAAITDLGVDSAREGIILTWSVDPLEKIGAFRILRSEPVLGSEACPGCPQDYRPLKTIPVTDTGPRSDAGKRFSYVDWEVRAGYFYSYRVAVCDKSGLCGAPSNEARLIHTGR